MFDVSCESIVLGILALLILICTLSDAARYSFKFCVFVAVNVLISSFTFPFMLLRPRDWRNGIIPAWLMTKALELMGVKFIVEGKENIVKDTGAVIVMNHQSVIDLGILTNLWLIIENGAVIGRRELLTCTGPIGWATYLWGTIFINRNNPEEAKKSLNATIDSVKNRKVKLLIFPEGTRHSDHTLRPFKKGAFHVAISGQVPIQPVVVSRYYFLSSNPKFFRSGRSYITILPPIPTEGLAKDDVEDLMKRTREIMDTEFKRSSEQALREAGGVKID